MVEIFKAFLRIGCLAFGGPIASMGMLEDEFVKRRAWLTSDEFSEMYAVFKLFPGPLSTQMAIYLGKVRRGTRGAILSGIVYCLPAVIALILLTLIFEKSGVKEGGSATLVLMGLQMGALAVILISALQLSKPYRKIPSAWVIALISTALVARFPRWEPLVIIFFGALVLLYKRAQTRRSLLGIIPFGFWPSFTGVLHSRSAELFWMCFKGGAFVFGSGIAIVPMLEGDAVSHYHWLTHSDFMNGLVLGQITPGPIVVTATYVGYKTLGLWGALIATVGIFLPAFINVLVILPRTWGKLRGNPGAAAFTSGAIPAVVGGIFGFILRLGAISLSTPLSWAIFLGVLALALWKRIPAWGTILLGGICGAMTVLW